MEWKANTLGRCIQMTHSACVFVCVCANVCVGIQYVSNGQDGEWDGVYG